MCIYLLLCIVSRYYYIKRIRLYPTFIFYLFGRKKTNHVDIRVACVILKIVFCGKSIKCITVVVIECLNSVCSCRTFEREYFFTMFDKLTKTLNMRLT